MGRIQSLSYAEGCLQFVFAEPEQITLMKVSTSGGQAETVKQISYDTRYLISYAVGTENQIYAVTKMADILEIDDDGTDRTIYKGEDHDTEEFFSIPWKISADSRGNLYFPISG